MTRLNIVTESRPIRREPIRLHLPFPPSTNNLFVNVPGEGRATSRKYAAWRKEAGQIIQSLLRPRLNGRVEITLTVEERGRRSDLDNAGCKAVLDCLVRMGVIDSDDSKTVRKITLQWGGTGVTVEIVGA